MPARIPLDVDLEDKLLYGLTPTRLGYLVVALLAGFSVWTSRWASPAGRGSIALVIALIGVATAWGRWRGRGIDEWALDLVAFSMSEYHLRCELPRLLQWRRSSTK